MNEIIIVGAGGFGREALYLIKQINKVKPSWIIKGFIDDNLDALDGIQCDHKVIGKISDWQPNDNEVFAIGIASPRVKEIVTNKLKGKGANFETLISPYAHICDYSKIGEGCIVTSGSMIGDCVKMGNFVNVASAMIGQDSTINDFSTITGYVNVASAHIGKRVFVGSHSVILNGRKIGDDAFVCAGSIVFNNVRPGLKVIGNPAKKVNL